MTREVTGAMKRENDRNNPYKHPLRGIAMAFGMVSLFMLFLVGVAALVWWIA